MSIVFDGFALYPAAVIAKILYSYTFPTAKFVSVILVIAVLVSVAVCHPPLFICLSILYPLIGCVPVLAGAVQSSLAALVLLPKGKADRLLGLLGGVGVVYVSTAEYPFVKSEPIMFSAITLYQYCVCCPSPVSSYVSVPVATVAIELNKKQDGSEFLKLDWSSREEIQFLPTESITKELLSRLPSICGIAFVKRSYFKMGIVVAHEGYLIDQENLIHASSEYNKTVNVDFTDYLLKEGKPRFDGIMVYKIQPD